MMELLAPAGSMEAVTAAVQNGADEAQRRLHGQGSVHDRSSAAARTGGTR